MRSFCPVSWRCLASCGPALTWLLSAAGSLPAPAADFIMCCAAIGNLNDTPSDGMSKRDLHHGLFWMLRGSNAVLQGEKKAMIEQCEHEQLATVLVNTATVVRLPY